MVNNEDNWDYYNIANWDYYNIANWDYYNIANWDYYNIANWDYYNIAYDRVYELQVCLLSRPRPPSTSVLSSSNSSLPVDATMRSSCSMPGTWGSQP